MSAVEKEKGRLCERERKERAGERVNFTRGRQKFRRTFKAFNIKRPDRERGGGEQRIAPEVDPNLRKKNCIKGPCNPGEISI